MAEPWIYFNMNLHLFKISSYLWQEVALARMLAVKKSHSIHFWKLNNLSVKVMDTTVLIKHWTTHTFRQNFMLLIFLWKDLYSHRHHPWLSLPWTFSYIFYFWAMLSSSLRKWIFLKISGVKNYWAQYTVLGTENIETNKAWFLFLGGQSILIRIGGDHWGFTENMAFGLSVED